MIKKAIFLLVIVLTLCAQFAEAQKKNFRGVWVATFLRIDFPSQAGLPIADLKTEWDQLLDLYKDIDLNAVIVQVRPSGDAIYSSKIIPWSKHITGQEGYAPQGYDELLTYMITETHARNMEFHAWFNPYRATHNLDTTALAPNHVFYQHRDWLIEYGTRYYLNPGLPAVRNYLTDVVLEVVRNYDIDGVHFDDYFYPYRVEGVEFPDYLSYQQYGSNFATIADWRRNNTATFVQQLSRNIKAMRPDVQFGIGPVGVWRNREDDPVRGSDTRAGYASYDDLYADILDWLHKDWIDYIAPQVYWHIGHPKADFATIVNWWTQAVKEKTLYIGHAAYKVGDDANEAWQSPYEITRQLDYIDRYPQVKGSIFYNTSALVENKLGIAGRIRDYYNPPVVVDPSLPKPPTTTPPPLPSGDSSFTYILRKIRKKK